MSASTTPPEAVRRKAAILAVLTMAFFGLLSAQRVFDVHPIDTPSPKHNGPSGPQDLKVLYDGSLNTGTPDTQGFFYIPYPLGNVLATQVFTTPVTVLDTMPQMSDYAGYFAKPTLYPPLDRTRGYQVLFTVQIMTETHISQNRAGFSLLVVSSDKRSIELGFWANEVWAQEGGTSQPFTHAESAIFTTTTGLISYRLNVWGDRYTLLANESIVLAGLLRDYTLAPPPPLLSNPYDTPNLIFLGDDTSAAQARIKFLDAAVLDAPPFSSYLPLVNKN